MEDQIKTLQSSLKLKDDQVNTLKDSLSLKDDHVKALEDSLKLKEEKIDALQKVLALKEEQLKSAPPSSAESGASSEQIEELRKEIDILNGELQKADEDIEKLDLENEELRSGGSGTISTAGDKKIIDFTNVNISKIEILAKIKEVLERSLHNVTLALPDITDLQDLYLYEVRSTVNMKISCLINPGIDEHSDLLEEFESLDNISIRTYDAEDRYLIIRDGEELLMAVIGNNENNHLVFHTKDEKHIRFFNALAMETWMRSRKI